MATQSLTEKSILAIKPAPKQRLEVYDTKTAGMGIRVSASANGRITRTWVLLFRVGRRLRRMTLGRYDELSLDEARTEAAEARLKARKGFDPAEERRQRQREQERAQSETFRAVSERFLRQYVRRDKKLRSADEYERIIDFDLLPAWGDRPIGSLTRRDVIDVIEAVKDRGAPTMANRVLAVARKLSNWAVSQDLIAHSPCVGVRTDVPETKRDHFLKDDEIRALWPEAETYGYPFGPLIQLLLLTGQRLSEVAGMRWSELALDKAEWHIPPERTKAKRALLVPLSRPAVAIIKDVPKIDRRDFVFSTTGESAVSGFSKVKRHLHGKMLTALKKQAKE
ncbi:MAG TPA: integrase arm-type DNA-binding domain-containing protein, partial [Alphaproteobacteria bacterium]|nr:integrase arm-type DNA-binding domain-containing protein [Alphaproteobacteria bacterium]